MKKIDALNEVDQDTLAKIALATAAGVAAAAGGRHLYKKYKEYKALKKYGSQEEKHPVKLEDVLRGEVPEVMDIVTHGTREYINIKK